MPARAEREVRADGALAHEPEAKVDLLALVVLLVRLRGDALLVVPPERLPRVRLVPHGRVDLRDER